MPARSRPLPLAAALTAAVTLAPCALLAQSPSQETPEPGYSIDHALTIQRCASCHVRDAEGRLSRISWLRKTPEGWQTSIRRMVSLNDVELTPEEARAIVKYLSDRQGLAPEELRPALFEVERRLVEHDYPDDETERTCINCHSMGRVMTQRRTREEWELVLATHRALYPLVDGQAFRRGGPPSTEPGEGGRPPDNRHPMERAVDHLARAFPLATPEWAAWAATMRPPRLEGRWLLSGSQPGKGAVYGTVTVARQATAEDAFTSETSWVYAETGQTAALRGQAVVYTGYQWRGRSTGGASELREVLTVERDWRSMAGRWFTGDYDELGPDVTLRRIGADPVVAGVHPRALEKGASNVEVSVFGANLPAMLSPADFDFGTGVTVASVAGATAEKVTVRVSVAGDARVGGRDLFVGGVGLPAAVAVHDGVDRIEVTPQAGMARVGGVVFPKQLQVFDVLGWDDGADGKSGTPDDVALGRVPVTWGLEEYAATFGDDDTSYVGKVGADGTFTPAADGPNPERSGNRNNVGDVWVTATYARAGKEPLRARGHLLVTVPLYARFDPWREAVR